MPTLPELFNTLPQVGQLTWIGLRPERRAKPIAAEIAEITPTNGLTGDHYRATGGKRQVTLIQAEHIEAVASLLGKDEIDPADLRRNLVVRGINLLALHDRRFWVGEVLLEGTGHCHPCSRMEENLGPGGYNAMRGHGGITARVVSGGEVTLGDWVRVE